VNVAAKKSKSKPKAKPAPSKPAGPFALGDTVRVTSGDYGNARGVVERIDEWGVFVRIARHENVFDQDQLALVAKARPRS